MRWLGLICRLAVGGVFLFACWDKLLHPQAFATAIDHYHLVPYSLLHPLAQGLPVLEMLIGLALVLGICRRGASLLAMILMVVFLFAISSALIRGLDISCGCFHTDGGHLVGISLLLRDVILLILCLPPLLLRDAGPEIPSHQKEIESTPL